MEDKLKYLFTALQDQLKFAEAKNAVMITLSGAIIFGLLSFIKGNKCLSTTTLYYLYSIIAFCFTGAVIAIISFLPQNHNNLNCSSNDCNEDDNLLFWGHIKKYDVYSYLNSLKNKYWTSNTEPTKIERDMIEQIVIVSHIAARKYRYFSIAAWFIVSGILTPLVGVLLYYVMDPNKKD